MRTSFDSLVRQECLRAARVGHRLAYSEMTGRVGLDPTSRGHQKVVIDALKANMRDDHANGRPYSCVAVERLDTELPGWKFVELAWELGRFQGNDHEGFIEAEWDALCQSVQPVRPQPASVPAAA